MTSTFGSWSSFRSISALTRIICISWSFLPCFAVVCLCLLYWNITFLALFDMFSGEMTIWIINMSDRIAIEEDPFTSPPRTLSGTLHLWTWKCRHRFPRHLRTPRLRITPVRSLGLLLCLFVFVSIRSDLPQQDGRSTNVSFSMYPQILKHTDIWHLQSLLPSQMSRNRAPDVADTFANYKHRAICNISSLDLHVPFSPLCQTRQEMLDAMAGGGRIGRDAPYMPRGCDMRWFTSDEVCEILGRFNRVILVGDSMIRHVIGSINIFLRQDIGYGAVTDWNFSAEEKWVDIRFRRFDLIVWQRTVLLQRTVRCESMFGSRYLQDCWCAAAWSEELQVLKKY